MTKITSVAARFVMSYEMFLNECNILLPELEYRFAPPRKWRFDYCWPKQKVALEIEGGVWTRGRHTRGAGFLKDMEKYNEAARLGYLVLRTTPTAMWHDATIRLIHDTLLQAEGRICKHENTVSFRPPGEASRTHCRDCGSMRAWTP